MSPFYLSSLVLGIALGTVALVNSIMAFTDKIELYYTGISNVLFLFSISMFFYLCSLSLVMSHKYPLMFSHTFLNEFWLYLSII